MRSNLLLGTLIAFVFIVFSGSFLLYSRLSPEKNEPQLSWEELARNSFDNPTFKNRKFAPSRQQRGVASEKEERIFRKMDTVFMVSESQVINIQKNKLRPPDLRIATKNLNSGNSGYLSGDIVLFASSKEEIPLQILGSQIAITQELEGGQYVLSVLPSTNVVKVYDELLKTKKFKMVELDLVDQVIQPR